MMNKKTDLDNWARKSIPLLKKYGYLEEQIIEGSKNNWLLPVTLFIIGMMFGGILIYAINHDAFKSEFNQEIDPNISVNTQNQYEFNPVTENEYRVINNHTIINNVIIPSDLCGGSE